MSSKNPITPPRERFMAVRLIGEHAGKFGRVRYVDGLPSLGKGRTIEVMLDDGSVCFVPVGDIQQVASPPPPRKKRS